MINRKTYSYPRIVTDYITINLRKLSKRVKDLDEYDVREEIKNYYGLDLPGTTIEQIIKDLKKYL